MVIFRRKNICGISTENCVLCSIELEKDPIFRICVIRMDLRKIIRKILSHHRSSEIRRVLPFWWYRFQNSTTVKDNDLKFYMLIALGKLEDPVQFFLPGSNWKFCCQIENLSKWKLNLSIIFSVWDDRKCINKKQTSYSFFK